MECNDYTRYIGHFDLQVGDLEDFSNTSLMKCIKSFLRSRSHILDIGCGNGSWLYTFEKLGLEATGMDISDNRVKFARGHGLNAILHDITEGWPFHDQDFDVVFANNVIEHIKIGDRVRIIKEAYRVLKNYGYLIIIVPYKEDLKYSMVKCPRCGYAFNWEGHFDTFDKGKLSSELEEIGFRVIEEFVTMSIPFGARLPKFATKFICKCLLKNGYDVGKWMLITIGRKV